MLRFALLLLALAFGSASAQELLEPEKAFKLSARALDAQTLEVRFDIADGYYMYRDKFRFEAEPAEVKLGPPRFPPGKLKKDEFFGEMETYRQEVKILLPVTAPPGVDLITLKTSSQGCADLGVCYPPTPQSVKVSLSGAAAGLFSPAPARQSTAPAAPLDESSRIAQILKGAGFWAILASFFGFGLLLSLTPCMFPMIPILSGIVVGHGHAISKSRALGLSAAYVLGMAVTYAVAGVAAGLSGSMLSAALQNAWVLGGFALVFVLLALSMFGFYELQMPSFLQSKLSEEANRQQGGSVHGVAVMGALSAIIAGPCVAAPLAGALLYIAQTRDALLGGTALFVMALGMGLPLLAIGVSARSFLPKPGPWMEAVKKFFGVVLLALAIWIVSPVIPAAAQMLAWAALLIAWGVFLRAIDPLPPRAHGWLRFSKAVGIAALVFGVSLLVGALAGSRDPLQPLGFLRGAGTAAEAPVKFERVKSVAQLDARVQAAGRPVMLDFYADWCVSCKEMERFTFSDPAVKAKMERMLLLQADVTANDADDKALLKRFGLFGPPGIVFFDARGKEIDGVRVIGFQPAEAFGRVLDSVLSR
ncbi:MAG: protein-disulfide reductase DsbD [Pseudomonadota bacterium]|jgi:thiol:disulfide interchange protein DsbD